MFKLYRTNAALGYGEYIDIIRLDKTENGYNYLVVDRNCNKDDVYPLNSIVKDLEDYYVQEVGEISYNDVYKFVSNPKNSLYNKEYTWEYNLERVVRWDGDAKSDVCFYVRHWLDKIAEEEGYMLVKIN